MLKLQFFIQKFFKFADEPIDIDPQKFMVDLIKELQSLDQRYKNMSRSSDREIIKTNYASNVLNDAIDIIRNNMNNRYAYALNPDQEELESIYIGINNILNFFIKRIEKLKQDFASSKLKIWMDKTYNILSNEEKIKISSDILDKVLQVLK